MTHIHTHACVNVCDFAINGSIYVLCFEIALVLIFYYGVINFSVFLAFHVITTTVVAAPANRHVLTTRETKRGNHINGLNVRE